MDIGTAKPTPEQRRRIPHHLIDVADPDQVWSLTLYQEAAHKAIDGILDREHLPFLVGGTGQYIRAVIEAWQIPTIKPDPNLRRALENWADSIGPKGLHQRLTALDPQAADKIDYRNLRRTIRALEVILHSGKQFSNQRRRNLPPYEILDQVLQRYVEQDWSVGQIIDEGFDAEMVRRVARLVLLNEYKRRQAPPGVRITHRAFGRDRRYPITSGWKEM
jgi:tRNA dimethylallyltransferase